MTKLQKIGLVMSVVAAILWIVGIFAGWNYSLPPCVGPNLCMSGANYHLIHYVLISLFAIGICIILIETSRKSLKKSCIVSILSVLLGWFSVDFAFLFLGTLCAGDCRLTELPGHISLMLGFMFIILWFVALFFTIKHSTNNNKSSIFSVLLVAFLVVGLYGVFISKSLSLWGGIRVSSNIMFLLFSIISITFCIIAGIKRYKEAKKSS